MVSLAAALSWKTCLDIGANDGLHVRLLAQAVDSTRHFAAVDSSNFAVSKFVKSLEADSTSHTFEARLGTFMEEHEPADLVLALALTHHLALQDGESFAAIAHQLSGLTKRHCIVEFMPHGLVDGDPSKIGHQRETPDWYSLENFLAALNRVFKSTKPVISTFFDEGSTVHRIAILAQH